MGPPTGWNQSTVGHSLSELSAIEVGGVLIEGYVSTCKGGSVAARRWFTYVSDAFISDALICTCTMSQCLSSV